MLWVTAQSASSVERHFEEDASVIVLLKTIGPTAGRALLRHQAMEENRDLVEMWEYAQIFWGVFFFAFLLLGTREGKFPLALALLMLLLVILQRFLLTPELNALGRPLDFAAKGGAAKDQGRYVLVQSISIGLELLKWAAGILLAGMLIFQKPRRRRSGYARQEVDFVDKANHGHIDR